MKNRIILKAFLIISVVTVIISCSDDDSNLFEDPHFAAFLGQSTSVVVSEGGNPVTLNFGITKVQSQDVTITLQVTDQTAVQGTDYSLSGTTVTIPAGEYNGSILLTPVDNNVFNESKTLVLEISAVSASDLVIGNADEHSYKRTVVISNDDCPTQSNIWWGNLSIEDVGYGFVPGTGSANSSGDCDVLVINGDLPNAGVGGIWELYFTPDSLGATTGTVDVPEQLYCSACLSGFDLTYIANGTYDEVTQQIILFYSVEISNGTTWYTGINVITPQ